MANGRGGDVRGGVHAHGPLRNGRGRIAFDATELAGKEIVVFESLEREGREVASHADIHDEAQTVTVEPGPEIGTVAADGADGDHEVSADGSAHIDDQVFYSGLDAGGAYRLERGAHGPGHGKPAADRR